MREPVAGDELAQPPGVGREGRSDDAQAGAESDQPLAAQEVGPEQQVAEYRVVADQRAQAIDGNDELLTRFPHDGREQGSLPREQALLAEEPSRAVHGDQPLPRPSVVVNHGDLAVEHDMEVIVLIALAEQHLSGAGAATHSLSLQARQLILCEPRKGAVLVGRLDELLGRRVHGAPPMWTATRRNLVRILTGI